MEFVFHDDFVRELEPCSVYCAKIKDRKQTSNLVSELKKMYPLQSFSHLKRVKPQGDELHIIIKEAENTDTELNESLIKLEGLDSHLYLTSVPKWKPLTRSQFSESKKYWPCNFHENKRIERLLAGVEFSEEEMQGLALFMKLAEDEVKASATLGGRVGAVLVDPRSGSVIARATSSSFHPLKHAVMLCIDALAHSQGGGMWDTPPSVQGVADEATAMVTMSGVAATKPPPKKKLQLDSSYLCSDYDMFVTREPCVMCAMALVHSRVRRVFYNMTDTVAGGLGGWCKLHCHQKINHHFDVFKQLAPFVVN